MFTWSTKRFVAAVGVFVVACASTVYLVACPFCSAINLTFTEQIKTNDIVVIAKLMEIPQPVEDPDAEIPKSVFEITDVIKGNDIVRSGMKFRSLLIGRYPIGDQFLVMGVDPPNVAWSTPMKASKRVVGYLQAIQSLPKSGVKRLAFFQQYFEDEESVLAFDAYDEFAQAPYEDVVALKDQMNRPQLVKWIKDKNTSTNRRRLYFTMLGICGQPADIKMLEGFIQSGDRKQQAGLDALIACYLTLKGEAGLDLIVDSFLKEKDVEYVDTLAAVTAIRFHGGTDVDIIPKSKVVAAIRTLLDRPDIADMVIPDLARWEDWSVMDKLVQMFKEADEETSWVRVPIASYLRACPKPEAKHYIAELQKIDPNSIKRADFFLGLGDDEDAWGDGADDAVAEETNDSTKVNDTDKTGGRDGQPETTPAEDDKSATHLTQRIPLVDTTSQVSISNPRFIAREANYENTSPVVNEEPNAVASVEPDLDKSSAAPGALVAQTQPTLTPVASAEVNVAPVWQIVLIPMAFSLGIFVLLWSVISGWFDRLIY